MFDKALKATTQQHLDIYTVKDDLLILKDGTAALILQVNAINFGLLSEQEQDATIHAYAQLLNSLSFPIQILVRSIRKDISDYIDRLDQHLKTTKSQKLKEQIVKYRSFVKGLVKQNKVLEKKFYVIIPYSQLTLKDTFTQTLNPFSGKKQKPDYKIDYIIKKAQNNLFPRRDHLIDQFARLSLQAQQLNTRQLMALLYHIYNPNTPGGLPNLGEPQEYQTPTVQSQSEQQSPSPQQTKSSSQTQNQSSSPESNQSSTNLQNQ